MGLTEIQKQTIAQSLRDEISIRALAAEVGVPFYWPNKKEERPYLNKFIVVLYLSITSRSRRKKKYRG
jgi:hypothetical protein